MSDLRYYRTLLTDRNRIEAFRGAIARTVRPGDNVLDIGTGLGTFAMFAVDAGAARVWAVDGNPIVHVARTIARLNGYGDRIEFIRGWLPDVDVPDKVDVVLFEDFPARFLNGRVYRLLSDVCRNGVASRARLIPVGATLWAAPLSCDALYRALAPLGDPPEKDYGVAWEASREYVMNEPLSAAIPPGALVAAPARLSELKLASLPRAEAIGGHAIYQITRAAPIHGLAYWFDLDLAPGIGVSNAPGPDAAAWGQLFLPIDPPLDAKRGDELAARVWMEPLADGTPAWLGWTVQCGTHSAAGHEFRCNPMSLQDLALSSPDVVPRLTARGALEAEILALVDGTRTTRDIARSVQESSPSLSEADRLRLVAGVLRDKIVIAQPRGIGTEQRP